MKKRILALALALSLLLSSCGGGRDSVSDGSGEKDTPAASMHLKRTEGTVSVSDDGGKDVAILYNLDLYSGYGVKTHSESYAWIDLDDVRLTKLDQESEIAIQQDGKALDIELKSGSLFFNVTEPLGDGETMSIRTSTMLVGIRGTCGWVVSNGERGAQVFLLVGTVEAKAAGTGETVRVTAGNMAEVTVSENGEAAITVRPFIEEDTAPFVLTELENDAALSAAILEDSGMDILNPPDPAERLMADYRRIIASRPILDNGAAEGVSYTFNGTTFTAENGLTDAVCVDLDGDGTEELLLVTREQGTWNFGRPISRLEVYGSEMGRAVLLDSLDSADIVDEDYTDEYGTHYDWPNYFYIVASGGKLCIFLSCAYQSVENEYLFAWENGALVLIANMNQDMTLFTQLTHINPEDGVYTELELPTFPEDVQRKNTLLASLDTAGSPAYYYFAKLVNTDLYKLDGFGDFRKVSWNGTDFEGTHLEDNIIYAKLIDMDQDGAEELILITEDHQAVAYSWKDTSCERTLLCEMAFEYNGFYRDTVTGDIYLGCTEWRLAGIGEGLVFSGLTDRVECSLDLESLIDYSHEPTPDEQAAIAEAQEKFNREVARFESIEDIYPYLYGNNYEWQNQLQHTIDEVRQQLMAR